MTDTDIIRITSKAAEVLQTLRAERKNEEEKYIRIGVMGGGCGVALSYIIGFDKMEPTDTLLQVQEMECVVNKAQLLQLQGIEINWAEVDGQQGFVFKTAN